MQIAFVKTVDRMYIIRRDQSEQRDHFEIVRGSDGNAGRLKYGVNEEGMLYAKQQSTT
jgi:hypothetical protein